MRNKIRSYLEEVDTLDDVDIDDDVDTELEVETLKKIDYHYATNDTEYYISALKTITSGKVYFRHRRPSMYTILDLEIKGSTKPPRIH